MGTIPTNYVIRQPTLITDFSSSTGMNFTQGTGSVALDSTSTYVRTGTQSLKIVQQASASSAICDLDLRNAALGGTGSEGPSAAADNLWHLRCYVDTPANQNNLSFFVSNNTTSFVDYFTQNVMGPQISSINNQWWDRVESRKDWTVAGGSPTWASPIRYIRIRPNANANGALTTWCDALYRGGYARPKVILNFDDSSTGQYTLAKPILDTYGFRASFFVMGEAVSQNVSGALTQAQCDALYAAGHDISYHAWSNNDHTNFSTLTQTELETSSDYWQHWALKSGYTRSRFFTAYPTGAYSTLIDTVTAAKGYLAARGTIRLHQNHLLGIDNIRHLRGYSFDGASDSASSFVTLINNCITYGTTLNLIFHTIHATTTSGQQISTTDLTTILAHLYKCQRANLLDVVPLSEWYNGLSIGRHTRP